MLIRLVQGINLSKIWFSACLLAVLRLQEIVVHVKCTATIFVCMVDYCTVRYNKVKVMVTIWAMPSKRGLIMTSFANGELHAWLDFLLSSEP